jgi:yecA family protein
MTPDEIRTRLEDATGLPAEALAAATAQASAMAPLVVAVIDKAVAGVHLLPRQERLLLRGLHALAAARESSACPGFVALLRRPSDQLERLFGDFLQQNGTRLLLGLYDGNLDALYAALEDPDVDEYARWMLFDVLARLTWEGRAPRDRLVDLLDRFDRDGLAQHGDMTWLGWQDAVMFLGLKDFEARVRQAWESGRMPAQNQADHREWLEQLDHAAAHPDDPQRFVKAGAEPITDPVAALAWMGAVSDPADDQDDDTVSPELSDDELTWLREFLMSDQVPATSMTLEVLDGFFAALIAGPAPATPEANFRDIWQTPDGTGPAYDSPEQAQFVADLLSRHWYTIAEHLAAGIGYEPLLLHPDLDTRGHMWARGFELGFRKHAASWTPLLQDKIGREFVTIIFRLIGSDEDAVPLTFDLRAQTCNMLSVVVPAIRRFWQEGPKIFQASVPATSSKIGRNEPCPCGSGRKYKKCCGAGATPT